jgi:hypothetical protein
MSNLLMALLLTIGQWFAGFGILTLFNLRLKPALFLSLSVLLGIAVFSIVPFLLQLFEGRITSLHVFVSLCVICILVNIRFRTGIRALQEMWSGNSFRVRLYEIPFLLMIAFIVFVSVWRCFYYPPTPVDVLSGAEVIAEYTLREQTMINSVFEVEPSGNTLKPPFITCLQIIYKFAGFPFGQIWLSNIFICFTIILYHLLSIRLHRILVGIMMLLFLAIPEMYAFTFMILYDYSNAVFFFLAVYFLVSFFESGESNVLALAGVLMGVATYIRPETLVLAGLLVPVILWNGFRAKKAIKSMIKNTVMFLLPTILLYVISIIIYINLYIPFSYSIAEQVNSNLFNVMKLLDRFAVTNSTLIFSKVGIAYYGYFIFFFLGSLIAEVVFKRPLTRRAGNYLFAILVVYIAFPVLSHILPGLTIENSVKRAFFKLFPLMLLYMGNNSLFVDFSGRLTQWESKNSRLSDR